MVLRSKKSIFYTLLTNICRVLLAVVLVLSGFVKAVDPKGTMYKLQEYADAFSIDAFSNEWLIVFATILAAVEFLTGVFLFMGVYRKFVAFMAFLVFVVFTPFTLYVALTDIVPDCGCFGDAFTLSNNATFFKNLILLLLAMIVFLGRRRFLPNISSKNRWMVVLFSVFYIAFVEGIGLSYVPIIDFRNYAVGNDLRELVQGESGTYKVVMTFEKNGEQCDFEQDNLPDTTWRFVGNRSELVAEGRKPVIGDFSILDWESDYDVAEDVLAETGPVCILVVELLEEASVGRVDKINELYDYCLEHNVSFFAATSSGEENIELWRRRTGAEYPIYWADNMLLRDMVRANPGLMLLRDGIVVGKWNIWNMPELEEIMSLELSDEKVSSGILGFRGKRFWVLIFAVPMLVIVLLDLLTGRKKKAIENAQSEKPNEKENIPGK